MLAEPMRLGGYDLPKGTLITASCEPKDVGVGLLQGQFVSGWLRKPHALYTTHQRRMQGRQLHHIVQSKT